MDWLRIKVEIIGMSLVIVLVLGYFMKIIPVIEIGGSIYRLIGSMLFTFVPLIGFLFPLSFTYTSEKLLRGYGVIFPAYFAGLKKSVGAIIILILTIPIFFSFPDDVVLYLGSGILIIVNILILLEGPFRDIEFYFRFCV